jgi:hypothetical protein
MTRTATMMKMMMRTATMMTMTAMTMTDDYDRWWVTMTNNYDENDYDRQWWQPLSCPSRQLLETWTVICPCWTCFWLHFPSTLILFCPEEA